MGSKTRFALVNQVGGIIDMEHLKNCKNNGRYTFKIQKKKKKVKKPSKTPAQAQYS